jgi:3D (Asp-Asp-Asp) domain-containing protein
VKAQQKDEHGDILDFFARTTWYNKEECTHQWVTKKLPNGKKTRVWVDTDPWTKKGLTFTGAPLVKVGANRVGSIAVDPEIIPYGSKVMLVTKNGPEFYVACDTGGAVVSRRAAKRSAKTPAQARAIVVDCFRDREPGTYLNIKVAPYKGAKPFRKLSRSEKMGHFNLEFAKAPFMRANLG